jgi:type VI secretion system protein ImpG
VKLVGFAEDEALIPYPATVYPGFRLLQEYFTLPQKFAFFDVTGLEALPADKHRRSLRDPAASSATAAAGTRVAKENFRLFCTPVVNLFEHPTDPIKPDVDEVRVPGAALGRDAQRVRDLLGRQRHRHRAAHQPARRDPAVLHLRARARSRRGETRGLLPAHVRPAAVGDGVDTTSRSARRRTQGTLPDFDVISLDSTCTNRRLPGQLKVGDIRVPTATSPAVATFTNLTGVTQPLPPPIGRELSGACSPTWP